MCASVLCNDEREIFYFGVPWNNYIGLLFTSSVFRRAVSHGFLIYLGYYVLSKVVSRYLSKP